METTRKVVNAKREKETGLVVETSLEIRLFNNEGNLRDRTFMNAELEGDASAEDFIPFDELTVEKLMEWTVGKLGEEAIAEKEQELIQTEQDRIAQQEAEVYADGLPQSNED
jgi:hypothetical protein